MKTSNISAVLSAATVSLLLGAASFNVSAANLSDPEAQLPLAEAFNSLDKNADGKLTPAEASKDPLFTKDHFAAADADHDGTLDQKEFSTYKSSVQQKNVKNEVEDSVITAKAKAEILATKDLKTLQISVETHNGIVILSGFVDNEAAKTKAEEVVAKIDGVKSVNNGLVVKSS
jgi:hyperosmotically inducible periplasmic protein